MAEPLPARRDSAYENSASRACSLPSRVRARMSKMPMIRLVGHGVWDFDGGREVNRPNNILKPSLYGINTYMFYAAFPEQFYLSGAITFIDIDKCRPPLGV